MKEFIENKVNPLKLMKAFHNFKYYAETKIQVIYIFIIILF